MPEPILVFGHRNPDTDSIASTIAYAELKNRLGMPAVPRRLGEINRETRFVLERFGLPAPEPLETVKTQVGELDMDPAIPISPETTLKTAWALMKKHGVKALPVTDDTGRLMGMATLSDITEEYMDTLDANSVATCGTPLSSLMETLQARIVAGEPDWYAPRGKVAIAAMTPERMGLYAEESDIVIAGNRQDAQIGAMKLRANVLIVTGGSEPDPEVIAEAEKARSIILVTPLDTFAAARLINLSIPVRHVMSAKDLVTFVLDDFVDEVREAMSRTRYRAYPVLDAAGRIRGFIARFHLISPRRKRVILVDHNERGQSAPGIEEAEILEIVDHHRIADVQTIRPIVFRNEPVGSTATLVAGLYGESGIRPPRPVAGLLAAAILSDTVNFRSPTCTRQDRVEAERMAAIGGIGDLDALAAEMFRAGTSLAGRSAREIFEQDFKTFLFGRHKIGIGQVNLFGGTSDLPREAIREHMGQVREAGNYSLVMLLATDVSKEESEVLAEGEGRELLTKAFGVDPDADPIILRGVVSRKKQVVPPLALAAEE
jgi:manganese-dependent inorganic pyrophosphatase